MDSAKFHECPQKLRRRGIDYASRSKKLWFEEIRSGTSLRWDEEFVS